MGGMPDFGTYDFYCGKGTDAVLARIRRFTELRFLDLSYSRITDAGLENLAQLRKIELLRLTGTPVTDIGLKNLAPMAELTSLELRGTGLTDRGTQRLPWTKKLKTLDLGCTKITEASLRHFCASTGSYHFVSTPSPSRMRVWSSSITYGRLRSLICHAPRSPTPASAISQG